MRATTTPKTTATKAPRKQSAEADLAQLRDECLKRFARVAEQFERMQQERAENGADSKAFAAARDAVREELRTIRFTAKTIERLCADVQSMVDDVRVVERQAVQLLVDRCGMDREDVIARFPGNETNLSWGSDLAAESRPYSAAVARAAARPRGSSTEADRHPGARGAAAGPS
ncbi:sigma-70 non-essential region-containing protein [Cupriavidus basilensis]